MGGGSGRRNEQGRLEHGGAWRSERQWPLEQTVLRTLHMRAGGGLTDAPPRADEFPSTYIHDPDHPVPSIAASVTGLSELVRVPGGVDPAQWPPRYRARPLLIEGGAHQKEEPDRFGSMPPYPLLEERSDVLVFETEPLPKDHPLWSAPNFMMTPHTAASGPYLHERRVALLVENAKRFANGEELVNIVDKRNWF